MKNISLKLAAKAGQAFVNPANWERHQKTVKVGAFVVTASTALFILAIAACVLAVVTALVVLEHHWRHGDIQAWSAAKGLEIKATAQGVRRAIETTYVLFSSFIDVASLWGSVLGNNVISFVRGRLLPFVSSTIELALCCA